jgi:hypothetical protein
MDMNNMGGGSDSNTGTRDVTYDLTAVLYHALQGAENCQTYMGDAQGKQEHRQFFQMAMDSQRQIAEQCKQLLHNALMQETGGSSMMGGQQGMGSQMGQTGGMTSGAMSSDMSSSPHLMSQSEENDSAFRFASSETPGGSDQFGDSSEGQRYSDRSTSGGSSSSF